MALLAACVSPALTAPRWEELPSLPPPAGEARALGVAGPFAGVHRDALLVAGGANFPLRPPWDGGAKVWWQDIWVLERPAGGGPRWVSDRAFRLPRPLGYGVSIATPEGVVCIGGHDADGCRAEVFQLAWDPVAREVRRTALPSLPAPLTFMAGALVGRTIYVAGGQHAMKGAEPTTVFWALDLSRRDVPGDFAWRVLPAWPGPARVLPVAAAQQTPRGEEFFLFSGRAPQPGAPTRLLTDAYAYEPRSGRWRPLPAVGGGDGVCVMGATAAAVGSGEIWILGGDRGDLFRVLEAHDLAIEELRRQRERADASGHAGLDRAIAARVDEKRRIYAAHPGFSREILIFDVARESWRAGGALPQASPVTTEAVRWDEAIVLPSGEIGPGVRTPRVLRVTPAGP